ncbi:cytidylyltransferase domain-containing protein [Brachybacterium saurashtrense]|uniref:Acylneuraminate cytidylyltransferase family protein n=1 Tax=Brachybacterium saurashtrense TaxID=556288 RepID=A0A345YSF2_9MICO|nr:acylneuraminate cytidylyltransferase family protein [Brachybacterium saurashtrense]AXK46854.1 acylneuraminate cytidylyltransferase family protein [Brachybacterium saurashtrense]RRR22569.1 acylneuraminate cytidylyltransferase family protein [Brachybacterium saurashtrense]
MSILAVIPARGGSQGIPRKNLLPVGGRPLLAWTIAQALEAREDGDVIVAVSTEDAEIAQVAREHGARVIDRPAELATHTAPTEPTVLHAMDTVEAEGVTLEAVVLLQATSPVRRPDTIRRAIAEFRGTGVDSLVGVVPESPFFWRLPEHPGASARAAYDVAARPRRQELTPQQLHYFENGSLYVTAPHVYRTHRNRIGGRTGLFVLDEVEGVDIDTLTDVAAAESMLARLGWRTS